MYVCLHHLDIALDIMHFQMINMKYDHYHHMFCCAQTMWFYFWMSQCLPLECILLDFYDWIHPLLQGSKACHLDISGQKKHYTLHHCFLQSLSMGKCHLLLMRLFILLLVYLLKHLELYFLMVLFLGWNLLHQIVWMVHTILLAILIFILAFINQFTNRYLLLRIMSCQVKIKLQLKYFSFYFLNYYNIIIYIF